MTTQASDAIVKPPTELTLYPKHESMILEWEKPIDSNPTDYIIQYKRNYETAYTVFDDGVSTDTTVKVTGLSNYRIHDFKVASKVGNDISEFTNIESKAPSDRCSNPGSDRVYSKCYALQQLSINPYQATNERHNVNGVVV